MENKKNKPECIKTYLIIIAILLISHLNSYGQIIEINSDRKLVKGLTDERTIEYIDKDDIPDSIYFDFHKQAIVFLLSTVDYKPTIIDMDGMFDYYEIFTVDVCKGGMVLTNSTMRTLEIMGWMYEDETGKFRLSHLYEEYHGPDGNNSLEYDFLTGKFAGDWTYYDYEADSLITLPTVNLHVNNPVVYFNDSVYNYYIPDGEFWYSYQEANVPSVTHTGRFNTFLYEGGGEHYELSMETSGGMQYNCFVGCNFEQIHYGDLISITEGTTFYQEPGNGKYYARVMINDIQLLEPGDVSRFHENNRKEIEYHPNTELYTRETFEDRILDGIAYFLASTNHKPVKKSLKKQGKMDIYISDYQQENQETDTQKISLLTEIFNTHKGKTEKVCRFLMEMEMHSPEEIKYHIIAK